MQPDYKVLVDNKNVTSAIRQRLLSLSVTDAAGIESDALELCLDNRDGSIEMPRTGAQLDVSLGYKESVMSRIGTYIVDEVSLSGSPDKMTIRARAADLRQSMKSQKTRAWENVTIGSMVSKIAGEHGYTARVSASLARETIAHIDQVDESDLHFLTRLAGDRGAIAKPAGGVLLLVPRGEVLSASGKQMPAATLARQQIQSYEATYAERGKYSAVQARWYDAVAAKEIPISVGAGEPVLSLGRRYRDAAEAKAAARSKLAAINMGKATLSLSVSGNPALMAEVPLTVSGMFPKVNGRWIITQVTHRYDGRGYRCDIEAETPKAAEGSA